MSIYRLLTSGSVSKESTTIRSVDDFEPSDIGYDEMYMMSFSDDTHVYFLLMHQDNDFEHVLRTSTVPINKALISIFPTSPYVGDMILVKAFENPYDANICIITSDEWSIDDIPRKFEMIHPGLDSDPLARYIAERYVDSDAD